MSTSRPFCSVFIDEVSVRSNGIFARTKRLCDPEFTGMTSLQFEISANKWNHTTSRLLIDMLGDD
jgi:hypothetical protein